MKNHMRRVSDWLLKTLRLTQSYNIHTFNCALVRYIIKGYLVFVITEKTRTGRYCQHLSVTPTVSPTRASTAVWRSPWSWCAERRRAPWWHCWGRRWWWPWRACSPSSCPWTARTASRTPLSRSSLTSSYWLASWTISRAPANFLC